jgi:hypothetical protein
MVLDASMDIGTDHRSYSDVDSTVNTNVTLFEFHHMTALGLGILVMLAIRGEGGLTRPSGSTDETSPGSKSAISWPSRTLGRGRGT